MPVICPKCSHVRPANATNPDWQCPACGICYAKFKDRAAEQGRLASTMHVEVKQGSSLGWLFKILLLLGLFENTGDIGLRDILHAPGVACVFEEAE